MVSDLAYNVGKNEIFKNRFGTFNSNLPPQLELLMCVINDILDGDEYSTLTTTYNKSLILNGLFLTHKFYDYEHSCDELDYHILRYKYGCDVSNDILYKINEKYPEKLI